MTSGNDGDHDGVRIEPSSLVVGDLVQRGQALLAELEVFRKHLKELRKESEIEVARYHGNIRSELAMLERLSSEPDSDATKHVARSSNLPFLETVWSVAKSSKNVVALTKPVLLDKPQNGLHLSRRQTRPPTKRSNRKGRSNAVMLDVVADDGAKWTKVSLVSNTRLLFDLAKEGWDSGASDEDGEFVPPSSGLDEDPVIPIVKAAKQLSDAAKEFQVRTKCPVTRLILPRVQLGETPEIDRIIKDCQRYGVHVHCGDVTAPEISSALNTMCPDPRSLFSETLNIDCTILLALVSEFSHAKVDKEPWFHTALERQVEVEDNEKLLPTLLYPALCGHPMVCTLEAAKRMREIVETIGTPSEKARTAIFLGDDVDRSSRQLAADLQQWSRYDVPPDLQLPIRVVDFDLASSRSSLPDVAEQVTASMTAINKSIFLHGWSTSQTTITSNRTVVRQLEKDLDSFTNLDSSIWPKIWLCPLARSLVGKEKRGAPKGLKPFVLPDPLRREAQRRNGLDVLEKREGGPVEDLRPNGYKPEDIIAREVKKLKGAKDKARDSSE